MDGECLTKEIADVLQGSFSVMPCKTSNIQLDGLGVFA
jgi:hypothetical protein